MFRRVVATFTLLALVGAGSAHANTVTPGPAPSCISIATPCITVPVVLTRTDAVPIRGYSVTFQLSADLQLCNGTGDIGSGGSLINPHMLITSNGGGSYTVDEVTLGTAPCGATTSATLFSLPLKSATPTATGTVTITAVTLRDCSNAPVTAGAGAPLNVTIDQVAPTAVANLAGAQVKSGNDADGTTKVTVSFTAPGDAATVEVYRKGFGGYPQYDENGGVAPTAPAAYPPAGWTLTAVTASGQLDEPATRDFWYYVVYTKDACGNVSSVSNLSSGTLNYHLGDVHDGVTNCAGNNQVTTGDISFLGSHYGIVLPVNDAFECLDVGPTIDLGVDSRPSTDNRTNFEDLILLAINYNSVTGPQARALPLAAAANAIRLRVPALSAVGETFAVGIELSGAGTIQGLTSELGYDAGVVEFLGVEAGALLARQARQGIVLSGRAGNVDVALLGAGAGLVGEGEVAQAIFRVRAAGDPRIGLRSVDARDAANRPVVLDGELAPVSTIAPSATALAPARPTPFRDHTVLEYALARGGAVELAVYSVDGRKVRTLERGERGAGVYRAGWDGRDDRGVAMAAGMYYARLVTAEGRFSRTLIRVR